MAAQVGRPIPTKIECCRKYLLQSDAFAQNDLIKNPVFSGLTVDDKDARVGFKLVFTVALEDLSYQKFVDGLNGVTTSQSTGTVPPTTQTGTSNPAGAPPANL